MIEATMDNSQVRTRLKVLQGRVDSGIMKSLRDIGAEILRLSQEEVPLDEATLQNSGTVEDDGNEVVVGYHTPYAARLHEHPEYRFKNGRKGKYLEDPIVENQKALGIDFGKSLEAVISTGAK